MFGPQGSSKSKLMFLHQSPSSKCLENNTCNLDVPWSIPIDENGDTVLET